jgi:DNA-binding CsgD family transcriptional regulator
MRLIQTPIDILERAYEIETLTDPWLESLRRATERTFSELLAVQAYTFRVSGAGEFHLEAISSDAQWEALLRRAHALAAPEVIRQVYLRRPVQSVQRALVGREGDSGYQEILRQGVGNITLSLGIDPGGNGCALAFLHPSSGSLPRPVQQALQRISAHVGSARRLRGSLDGAPAGDLTQSADAVMTPDGKMLHAVGTAREPDARAALREAARRIDRARGRARADAEEALALWRALVDGKWSLIERFESDGRRILIARRNDPTTRKLRALNDRERKVVSLLAVGHSLKLCAYELGLAQSSTSEVARSAMRKLGVPSRAALVELHGAIVSAPQSPPRAAP